VAEEIKTDMIETERIAVAIIDRVLILKDMTEAVSHSIIIVKNVKK